MYSRNQYDMIVQKAYALLDSKPTPSQIKDSWEWLALGMIAVEHPPALGAVEEIQAYMRMYDLMTPERKLTGMTQGA